MKENFMGIEYVITEIHCQWGANMSFERGEIFLSEIDEIIQDKYEMSRKSNSFVIYEKNI